jgi:hypothetical protein
LVQGEPNLAVDPIDDPACADNHREGSAGLGRSDRGPSSHPLLTGRYQGEFFLSVPAPGLVVVDNRTRNQWVRSGLAINLLAGEQGVIAGPARDEIGVTGSKQVKQTTPHVLGEVSVVFEANQAEMGVRRPDPRSTREAVSCARDPGADPGAH